MDTSVSKLSNREFPLAAEDGARYKCSERKLETF